MPRATSLSHDAAVKQVRALARATSRQAIAGAFLASLGERPGFWRAPLCALAGAAAVPVHRYRPFSASSPDCAECGLLPEVAPGEVHERGQCLPGDLADAIAVLTAARGQQPPAPSKADAKRLSQLLALVGTLPATARESKLVEALRKHKLVTGDRYDVRSVIETLGACGILQTPEHPGFTTRWTTFAARQHRPSSKIECDPPIAFWTAAHGVDATNTRAWFGSFGVTVAAAARPRAVPVAKVSEHAARQARRAARSTELESGDVIVIPHGRAWYAATVVGHHVDKGGRIPVLEVLDWRGSSPPASVESLRDRRAAGTRAGTQRVRDKIGIGLWQRNDPQGRWRALDGRLPAPATDHLAPQIGAFTFLLLGKDGAGLRQMLRAVIR